MTIKQLEYFLAIAENGSITKAANLLRVSQPPVSLQLKSLEEELGCLLFQRDKKNLIITEKGRILQKKARDILNLVNETMAELEKGGETRSVLRIGAISSVCNRLLPEKALELKKKYPSLEFDIHEGSTTDILAMLNNREVDFGLVREPFNVPAYGHTPVKDEALGEDGQDCFMAVALAKLFPDPEAELVELASLRDRPLIMHHRYVEIFTNACRRYGFAPKIVCENDNIASSLSWAGKGLGIAIAPYTSAIQNTNSDVLMKKIDSPTIISKAHLVWNKNAVLTSEQRTLVQLFS